MIEHPAAMRQLLVGEVTFDFALERQIVLRPRRLARARALHAGLETLEAEGASVCVRTARHGYSASSTMSSNRRALICACRRRWSNILYLSAPPPLRANLNACHERGP